MSWKHRLLHLILVVCAIGGLSHEGFAQDAEKEVSFSEMTLEELSEYHTAKMRAYTKRYRAAPTKEEKLEVFQTLPTVKVYQDRLVELINEESGSEAGLEVIDWWYRRGGRRHSADVISKLILKNYSELKLIKKYVSQIAWNLPQDEAEQQLEALIKVNPYDSVKASASYQLHRLLKKRAKELEAEALSSATGNRSKQSQNAAEEVEAKAKTLRDSIYSQYADEVDSREVKYVDMLDAVEFAVNLNIGKPVPDIQGTDIDGVEFKLSDYDGNVRVISFWGNW